MMLISIFLECQGKKVNTTKRSKKFQLLKEDKREENSMYTYVLKQSNHMEKNFRF